MIRLSEYYLQPVHDLMKAEIMESHHIHCDETPFIMPQHSKEYMWVFHSPGGSDTHPLFLYEYLGGRSGEVLEKISIWISRDTRNRWLPAVSYAYEKK